jgi:hypothetical protein
MTTSHVFLRAVPLLVAIALAGCDFNPGADRTGCDGFIEVLRTLPDTTLVEDGPPLEQELESEEPFFRHTEGKSLSYDAITSSLDITLPIVVGETASVLQVIPAQAGESIVTVSAQDDCEKEASFSFNVEVVPGE